jgi:hypothetical protein
MPMRIDDAAVAFAIRAITAATGGCALIRAATAGFMAIELRSPVLLAVPAGSVIVLVALELLVEVATRRRGYHVSRAGVALLLAACGCSLAIGNAPGIVPGAPAMSVTAVCLLAVAAGLLGGPVPSAIPRAATVLFFAAVGAAWQIGVAPLLAIMLVNR